jgi:hypothetical protein
VDRTGTDRQHRIHIIEQFHLFVWLEVIGGRERNFRGKGLKLYLFV